METSGQAMGLNEKLNDDLTPKSSNNIDIHMMRATEYGAIAILSASAYGNPSNDNAITTTTGNETGMMLKTNVHECVAGVTEGLAYQDINGIYYDTYTASTIDSARAGDALGFATSPNPGAARWHKAGTTYFLNSTYVYLQRGNGGIFSYGDIYARTGGYARGVAVCGEGF